MEHSGVKFFLSRRQRLCHRTIPGPNPLFASLFCDERSVQEARKGLEIRTKFWCYEISHAPKCFGKRTQGFGADIYDNVFDGTIELHAGNAGTEIHDNLVRADKIHR